MAKTALPIASAVISRTGFRAPTCTRGGSRRSPAAGATPATTWRWVRRCWHRCWSPWWAGWACSRPCCGGRSEPVDGRRDPAGIRAVVGSLPRFRRARAEQPWDPVTAGVVLDRVGTAPADAVLHPSGAGRRDRAVRCPAGPGRRHRPRTSGPCVELIDARLAEQQTDGWHYDDMPPDGQAWRDTLAGLDADANQEFGTRLRRPVRADTAGQRSSRRSKTSARSIGTACDAKHVWSLWTRYACTAFYSHPSAWNEIGFPGPAYPRGYKNRGYLARGVNHSSRSRSPTPDRPTTPGEADDEQGSGAQRVGVAAARRRKARSTISCATTCAASTTPTRSTSSSSAAGAGGSTLIQRLARAGWKVVALDAGPFWDPDTDWVSDEAGSHHLYWTEPRVISGSRSGPARLQQLRAWGRRFDGALRRLHPAVPPERLRDLHPRRRRRRLADLPTPTSSPTTRRSRRSCRWQGRNGRGVTRTPTRTVPTRWAATARSSCAAREAIGHHRQGGTGRDRQRALRQPAALHLPRASACRAARSTPRPRPLITHIPDALAHGAEVRANAMVTRVEVDERTGRASGVHYVRDGVARFQRANDGGDRRLLDRDPSAAAQLGLAAIPRGAVQRLRPGRTLPHGARSAADRGTVRRRGAHVQGTPARGEHRGVLRDGPVQALQARVFHPDASPRSPSRGPSTLPPRDTGAPTCATT